MYHSSDIAEFHVMSWIYKLQTLEKYIYRFARFDQLGVDKKKTKEETLKEGCTVEEVPEDAEGEDEADKEEAKEESKTEPVEGENNEIKENTDAENVL